MITTIQNHNVMVPAKLALEFGRNGAWNYNQNWVSVRKLAIEIGSDCKYVS